MEKLDNTMNDLENAFKDLKEFLHRVRYETPREKTLSYVILFAGLLIFPNFLGVYPVHVLNVALYYIAIVSTWNLLAGYTGIFSLAQAAMSATGSYTTALLARYYGIHPVMGIILGGFVAALISYSIGTITLGMRGIYLALSTWAFAGSARLLISINYEITRGDLGLPVNYLYGVIPGSAPMLYYYTTLALTIVTLLAIYRIIHSRTGLFLQAIREDTIAAEVAGVDTVKYKKRIFILSGFIAGIFGAYYAHFIGVISPSLFKFGEMALIIIMTIMGGYGTFVGPIIGATVIELLTEYLREFEELRMVMYGVIVLIMMRTFRDGIWGILQDVRDRISGESKAKTVYEKHLETEQFGGENG
ncbi:MAG: branched-chain amino acid ABC transporter permease [Candidatus Lokiarchaeota archaeon]|nr:branched-chain amino acid ABC transporter permease [Candidatus Lokiarchaeota archaeon]